MILDHNKFVRPLSMKAPSPQLAESEIIDGLVKNPLSFFTGLTEKLGDHFTFKIGDLEIKDRKSVV